MRRRAFLLVDIESGKVAFARAGELPSLLRSWRGLCMDLTSAWDHFVREVGTDFSRTFNIDEVGKLAGLSRPAMNWWTTSGVLRPVVETPGRGVARVWDTKGAFVAAVLGALARQGVPLEILKHVADELAKAEAAGVQEPAETVR